jgi:6,7-dimethyl-8-ribityllumazine synthase
MKIAIVVSQFNEEVTLGLLRGAQEYLEKNEIFVQENDIFKAPGAFEIPLIAQTLARSGHYDGVICLGCVVKGDTAHFEFISLGSTVGLMQAMLKAKVPISFGILTTYTDEQAIKRSLPDAHNKGREAANACVQSIQILERIRELD